VILSPRDGFPGDGFLGVFFDGFSDDDDSTIFEHTIGGIGVEGEITTQEGRIEQDISKKKKEEEETNEEMVIKFKFVMKIIKNEEISLTE
jgi:hypothetical protein